MAGALPQAVTDSQRLNHAPKCEAGDDSEPSIDGLHRATWEVITEWSPVGRQVVKAGPLQLERGAERPIRLRNAEVLQQPCRDRPALGDHPPRERACHPDRFTGRGVLGHPQAARPGRPGVVEPVEALAVIRRIDVLPQEPDRGVTIVLDVARPDLHDSWHDHRPAPTGPTPTGPLSSMNSRCHSSRTIS